jgi:hypothetical protein
MATAMYKKLAIGALIIGPLTVQVLTTTVPTEQPAPGADNISAPPGNAAASVQPPAPAAPTPPQPPAAQTGDPLPTMSAEPTLDTTPQIPVVSADPAPSAAIPQRPVLGTTQAVSSGQSLAPEPAVSGR